jgi:hypothetical protein
VGTDPHKLIDVLGDEVSPGDLIRDHGHLRRITDIGASVIERSIVLFLDPEDGLDGQLRLPLFQTVSVWRVCRD